MPLVFDKSFPISTIEESESTLYIPQAYKLHIRTPMGLKQLVRNIFGTANDRVLRTIDPIVKQINALEPEFESLSDNQLKAKTDEFRQRLQSGETLDDILPEAFATVRETAKRTLGQRHYDVQLMGGVVLHRGMIAEMRTGEGKTLVSTLPTYLNALKGKGVHVVTVNDYLAKRDSEWMGEIHRFLGLSVSCITHELYPDERAEAYAADITYGTNNEFGFDYLRDNLKFKREEMVQREYNYAIIDEVDSILIDEARTPLIISGPVDDDSSLYVKVDVLIPQLKPEHYEIDEKARSASFTEEGTQYIEKVLIKNGIIEKDSNLYNLENISVIHHINQALRAHKLFEKDKDYIVKDDQVIIIDEFTGRMMEGRRFSEGLHQALEAKERVKIQQENQTLASITFQNYFRQYPKLSGMTGTAMTEAGEFEDIYNLQVVEVPTNIPVTRIDDDDDIYRTADEKYDAIFELIKDCYKRKQPVLCGTTSIEKSEYLSKRLKKEKIPHNVLNARQHEKEAEIIAQAGKPGTITIATNMAGRGTDIQLGGNAQFLAIDETRSIEDKKKRQQVSDRISTQIKKDSELVKSLGGLCVIGTERHESRRIDNQLRGRSGRQGDPGYTKFFLSAEDDLIRIFGADKKMDWVLGTMGEPGQPIAHPMLTKMMTKSQEKIEQHNYEIRKNLLKYDDVMNDQRKVIFEQRIELMEADDADDIIEDMCLDIIDELVSTTIPEKSYIDQWDVDSLEKEIFHIFGLKLPVKEWSKEEGIADGEIKSRITDEVNKLYKEKEKRYGIELLKDVYRRILLFTLDELWKDHLLSLDHLRQGINLRAYGQKDPLNEYKKEAFSMFEVMLGKLREMAINRISHMEITADDEGSISVFDRRSIPMQETRHAPNEPPAPNPAIAATPVRSRNVEQIDKNNPESWGRIGRNEPCPCGSGKKYKQCHGKI